jgi:hypothetical protein
MSRLCEEQTISNKSPDRLILRNSGKVNLKNLTNANIIKKWMQQKDLPCWSWQKGINGEQVRDNQIGEGLQKQRRRSGGKRSDGRNPMRAPNKEKGGAINSVTITFGDEEVRF